MPRTRVELDREQKQAEILQAAERRLRADGYGALSIAGIARELGLAQAAVYWYFPSKDDLLVAAMRRMLGKIKARKPKDQHDVVEKILWFADELAPIYPLRATMKERARSSPVVAGFLEETTTMLRAMLSNVLSAHVRPAELSLAVETFVTAVDGAYVRGLSPAERRRILRFTLERIIQRSDRKDSTRRSR